MDNQLKCEIVRDLLPSYVDDLTSSVTNEAIEQHLTNCPDCSAALKRMREPEPREQPPIQEVDYLKKVRRRSSRTLILGVLSAVILVAALFFLRFYAFGNQVFLRSINYDVMFSGDTIDFYGNFLDDCIGYSHTSFKEEDGIVTITVYGSPKSFFNRNSFHTQYRTGGEITEVRLGNLIVWENGTTISRAAAQVFAAKNPYIGDMSANNVVASAIGISGQFGNYQNDLQTDSEPYGWSLILDERIARKAEESAKEIMKSDSYVMLAAVGNLGYVTWDYKTEQGEQTYTVTLEEASSYAGRDIKQCAETATDLQELMQNLGIR